MSAPLEQELQEAFDEYRRRREELVEMHRRMAEISVKVAAPRKVVTVAAGQHGQILDVQFPTTAYRRLTPSELAAAVLETVQKAQAESRDKIAELMAPMMPSHFDVKSMLEGSIDVNSLLPREPDEDGIFRRLAK